MKTTRRTAALGLALLLLLAAAPAHAARRPSRKSPHTQIAAVCRVETAPAEVVHKNQRRFLEFDVTIVSFTRVPGDPSADPSLPILQSGRVHIVHDMSCGGERISLSPGDAAEIRGEYVAIPTGKDVIHFTHPADGSCGQKSGHPDGGIRKIDAAALRMAA
ncbi:MAG TPA: hypothetical protein VF554_00355 [Thermoanaerobaculia bacterium]|jgi:hypothetical protein